MSLTIAACNDRAFGARSLCNFRATAAECGRRMMGQTDAQPLYTMRRSVNNWPLQQAASRNWCIVIAYLRVRTEQDVQVLTFKDI